MLDCSHFQHRIALRFSWESIVVRELGLRWTEKSAKSTSKRKVPCILAAQCEKCLKWREIGSKEEYEEIRSRVPEDPFVCENKKGMSCEDAADLNYDSSNTWVVDKPGVPKTPKGFKRRLVFKKDYSRMYVCYITPTGEKIRSRKEMATFIDENQEYKYASLGDFNFTTPKVMEETIPPGISHKKLKPSKENN